MAQFDVYRSARVKGYLLDCQSDLLDSLATRVVIPMFPAQTMIAATRLNPVFAIAGQNYVLQTPMILSLPKERLHTPVASLAAYRRDIISALDMLWSGV
jgi:toxin CcdB